MTAPYRIERLGKQDRNHFDCGVAPLNECFHKQAGQDQRRRIAVCYVVIGQATEQIAGYYTLSAGSVLLSDLPKRLSKKLPRYPSVPVVRIGRLAVSVDHQGKKLGGVLLFDAIKRAADGQIGAYAVIVDAKDEAAIAFYKHHGFIAFESMPEQLFLPISDALKRLTC